MKLIEVKAYVIRDGDTYNIQYKKGNKAIRCDSFKVREMDGKANLVTDPINWVEDMTPVKVPRSMSPIYSYYFKDESDIWVKVGHSMDVLGKYVKENIF